VVASGEEAFKVASITVLSAPDFTLGAIILLGVSIYDDAVVSVGRWSRATSRLARPPLATQHACGLSLRADSTPGAVGQCCGSSLSY
jgi:hypothetical protein